MAGKRQHILPRFLLKGFASRLQAESVFAVVYRKGGKPFETNIENISVEQHFYGKEGEISADAEITDLESGYADLIDTLRGKKGGTQVSDPRVARFVAHLIIRTKNLRQSFRESTEYLLDEVTDYLSDFGNLKKLLLNNPNLMKEELVKILKDMPVPDWQKGMFLELMQQYAPALMEEQQPELQIMMQDLVDEVKTILPKAVRQAISNHWPKTRFQSQEQTNIVN